MKKLILIASLIVVILAQVFVIGQFFVNRYSIVLGGDKIDFLVTNLDLSEAKEKGCIKFELTKSLSGKGDYGILKFNEGFAELDSVAVEKPSFGAYIQNSNDGYFYFPYDKYYLDEIIEDYEELILPENCKAYIKVRVKEGKVELMDLIVNEEKIESYIE